LLLGNGRVDFASAFEEEEEDEENVDVASISRRWL
jgi:hypothetical protein